MQARSLATALRGGCYHGLCSAERTLRLKMVPRSGCQTQVYLCPEPVCGDTGHKLYIQAAWGVGGNCSVCSQLCDPEQAKSGSGTHRALTRVTQQVSAVLIRPVCDSAVLVTTRSRFRSPQTLPASQYTRGSSWGTARYLYSGSPRQPLPAPPLSSLLLHSQLACWSGQTALSEGAITWAEAGPASQLLCLSSPGATSGLGTPLPTVTFRSYI